MIELLEGKKNSHMDHLEDLPVLYGKAGMKDAISFVNGVHDMLKGHASRKVFTTTKVDGAPAIVCGINPENGKFFVATKSAFNKNPKLNYTPKDVDTNHGHAPGLTEKLKLALKYLKPLGITGVIQGDFLFDSGTKHIETIDGEQYITFQPNTIKYAIPVGSPLADRIKAAKFGIAFHTSYHGDSIEDLHASFGVKVTAFAKKRKDVFVTDVFVTDVSGAATFTKQESEQVEQEIEQLKMAKPSDKFLDSIAGTKIGEWLLQYTNSRVKAGTHFDDLGGHYEGFTAFVRQQFDVAASKLKTPEAQAKKKQEGHTTVQSLESRKDDLMALFKTQELLNHLKMKYLTKLNTIEHMGKTFFKMADGSYKVTTPEGFVAVSHEKGNAVKLVDRLSFSRQNFLAPKTFGAPVTEKLRIEIKQSILEAFNPVAKNARKFAKGAGRHGKTNKAKRKQAKQQLRKEQQD